MKSTEHDVGSKTRIPLPLSVKSAAVFDGPKNEYRYMLSRIWDTALPCVLWIMMNPSVADELADDRTVARCRSFAESWGYGSILVGNTFAYRCTDQKRLLEVADPVGPGNDAYLLKMAAKSDLIVFAYGKPHVSLRARGRQVADLFRAHGHTLHVLRLSQDGTPAHPLYLPGSLRPDIWHPTA